MPITFRGRDLITVHLALHYMASYPAAFLDKERMFQIRDLSKTVYDAIQIEHEQEFIAYEKNQICKICEHCNHSWSAHKKHSIEGTTESYYCAFCDCKVEV